MCIRDSLDKEVGHAVTWWGQVRGRSHLDREVGHAVTWWGQVRGRSHLDKEVGHAHRLATERRAQLVPERHA
eukprot:4418489-Prymnesium_polylepis.1